MSLLEATILALVQGLTEFLPISSSAHLILVPWALGWNDQGLAFDVVVHLGTLTAVCVYFRHDLVRLVIGWGRSVTGKDGGPDGRMAWFLGFATIPVGLAGLTFKDWVSTAGRDPQIIAWASIGFGLLLLAADRLGRRTRAEGSMGLGDAIAIGCAQALALVPGTSRSGVTMTCGLALGLTREAAARFSFLLSIPVIVLSGGLEVKELIETSPSLPSLLPLLVGFAVAAVSAYLCIKYLLIWLQRHTMTVFVAYRIALGAVILAALP